MSQTRIERRIAMIKDALANGELAPEQAERLRGELQDLQTVDAISYGQTIAESRAAVATPKVTQTPVKRVGRGRTKKAAQKAVSVCCSHSHCTVYTTNLSGRCAGHPLTEDESSQQAKAAEQDYARQVEADHADPANPPATVVIDPVTVTVTQEELKPVTFKRLYNNSWGLSGPKDAMVPGTKVTVTKRDGSTTEVVVGNLLGKVSKDGNQLAYIDHSAGRTQ